MKTLRVLLLILSGVTLSPAVTLVLFDSSTLPPVPSEPEGAHYDEYMFPSWLPLSGDNPMVSLRVDYDASLAPVGSHEILDTYFLSSSGTVVELSSSPTFYSARVDFYDGVTDILNPYGYAFAALHSDGGGLTQLIWTATYLNGTQQSYIDGIIPESSTSLMGVSALIFIAFRRSRVA